MLLPKLSGASKTITPSSITRKADCHMLSETTYTPPPTLFTAYPSFGSTSKKLARTDGNTGTYSFSPSAVCVDCATPLPQRTAVSARAYRKLLISDFSSPDTIGNGRDDPL